jgi:prophage antirepressor-like protein
MNDLQIIKGIRCYLDENGEAFLNLEDSAKGLGFTQIATSGNESIRWERVRKHLAAFKVIPTSGDSALPEYIPEPIFYLLSMKAENEAAKKFQHTIAYDVLPALRKTGTYSISGYAPKATSLGEVASFLKIMRSIMKENGQLPEKISEMAEAVCKQFNIRIPESFVRRDPFEQTSLFNITANIILPPHGASKPAKSR